MKIETKLDFKRYLKLMYILSYRKPSMFGLTVFGFLMLVMAISLFFDTNYDSEQFPFSMILFGFVFMAFMPITIYLSAKKNFSTNGRLKEKIVYEFTDEKIKIIGESFNSEMTWGKTYKIVELKNWILIYQNKLDANVIPKESFESNLDDFKEIVKTKNIKQKLK